jgi:mannose-1-phosphate guanylyltransferase/mannose-6-phosphate isomerase
MLDLSYDDIAARFGEMPDLSIDYAVTEKSAKVATLPIDVYWNDIGSWDSLCDITACEETSYKRFPDFIRYHEQLF